MATLEDHLGRPLKDVADNTIKNGSTVVDSMFGEGIVRGTVPLERGDGVNALLDWLGSGTADTDEPTELNSSLINSHVFMRWEKYGWQLGKTTEIITRSTPRLFKY